MNKKELEKLTRVQLQSKARALGVKANLATVQLIAEILEKQKEYVTLRRSRLSRQSTRLT